MIDGVHIWRAALDGPGWPAAAKLPAPERARASGFLRHDVARRWTASRWALRRVLCSYLDVPAAEIELVLDEHGKPRLRDGGPEFNLGHSEGLALVAVAERAVGVDVEAIRPGRDTLALAERALPAAEGRGRPRRRRARARRRLPCRLGSPRGPPQVPWHRPGRLPCGSSPWR